MRGSCVPPAIASSSSRSSLSTAARSAVPARTYSRSGRSLVAGGRWSWSATRAPFSQASSPPSSETSPASARSRVVLPAPFGPASASRSRRSTLNETPSKSGVPENSLRRPDAITIAIGSYSSATRPAVFGDGWHDPCSASASALWLAQGIEGMKVAVAFDHRGVSARGGPRGAGRPRRRRPRHAHRRGSGRLPGQGAAGRRGDSVRRGRARDHRLRLGRGRRDRRLQDDRDPRRDLPRSLQRPPGGRARRHERALPRLRDRRAPRSRGSSSACSSPRSSTGASATSRASRRSPQWRKG